MPFGAISCLSSEKLASMVVSDTKIVELLGILHHLGEVPRLRA